MQVCCSRAAEFVTFLDGVLGSCIISEFYLTVLVISLIMHKFNCSLGVCVCGGAEGEREGVLYRR